MVDMVTVLAFCVAYLLLTECMTTELATYNRQYLFSNILPGSQGSKSLSGRKGLVLGFSKDKVICWLSHSCNFFLFLWVCVCARACMHTYEQMCGGYVHI